MIEENVPLIRATEEGSVVELLAVAFDDTLHIEVLSVETTTLCRLDKQYVAIGKVQTADFAMINKDAIALLGKDIAKAILVDSKPTFDLHRCCISLDIGTMVSGIRLVRNEQQKIREVADKADCNCYKYMTDNRGASLQFLYHRSSVKCYLSSSYHEAYIR